MKLPKTSSLKTSSSKNLFTSDFFINEVLKKNKKIKRNLSKELKKIYLS